MRVIETVLDNRTGKTSEVSWGNVIKSDLSVVSSIASILEHQRDRENGEVHVALGRFTTTEIRIEL